MNRALPNDLDYRDDHVPALGFPTRSECSDNDVSRLLVCVGSGDLATYRARVAHKHDFHVLIPLKSKSICVREQIYATPAVAVAISEGVPQAMVRDPALIERTDLDYLVLHLFERGSELGEYGERWVDATEGDIVLVDYGRSFKAARTSCEIVTASIRRSDAPPELQHQAEHGFVFHKDRAATKLLAGNMRMLKSLGEDLTAAELLAAIRAIGRLAAYVIKRQRTRSEFGDARRSPSALIARAAVFVDTHMHSSELMPQDLVKHLGVSRATLYRIFESSGGVGAFIQSRRLDSCFRFLNRSDPGRLSVNSVAFRHGFVSNSHFSRVFKARFGVSPSDVRRAVQSANRNIARDATRHFHEIDIVRQFMIEKPSANGV